MDLATIIDQLMVIKRRPLDQVQQQQQTVETQLSAYGRISSAITSLRLALSPLRYPTAFGASTVSSSSDTVATATAATGAVVSSYNLVVTDLAQSHKLASARYADSDTALGTGTITLSAAGQTDLTITVDSGNNTLAGLRDAINDAAGNWGVSASLINEGGGTRLILQAEDTGEESEITVAFDDADGTDADNQGLSRLFYVDAGDATAAEEITPAQDASGTIDGFSFTSASNNVTGVVDNLTITLKAAGSTTLAVSRDNEEIKADLQDIVDKYNALREVIAAERSDSLSTDTSLGFIENTVSDVLNGAAGGTFGYLADIGITRDRYGVMSIDSSVLDSVLENSRDDVIDLFTDETTGIAHRLYDHLTALIDTDGLILTRQDSLNVRKDDLELSEIRLEEIIDTYEERLVRQFARLDQVVASFEGISSYLENQLSSNN
ncbi:MAG: hypothetical protein B0D89_00285 [Candidatus Sedimenticola endophacoides]|nr:MAG: hypothetical protein B0D89_00285 [Candidatus Sedimenticola endophacoides]